MYVLINVYLHKRQSLKGSIVANLCTHFQGSRCIWGYHTFTARYSRICIYQFTHLQTSLDICRLWHIYIEFCYHNGFITRIITYNSIKLWQKQKNRNSTTQALMHILTLEPYRSHIFMTRWADVRTITPVVSHCSTQFSMLRSPCRTPMKKDIVKTHSQDICRNRLY